MIFCLFKSLISSKFKSMYMYRSLGQKAYEHSFFCRLLNRVREDLDSDLYYTEDYCILVDDSFYMKQKHLFGQELKPP